MSKVKHDESLIESGQNTIAAVIPNITHTILLVEKFSNVIMTQPKKKRCMMTSS
jgi:hypothetical protein